LCIALIFLEISFSDRFISERDCQHWNCKHTDLFTRTYNQHSDMI
jgi:hypothetical protein